MSRCSTFRSVAIDGCADHLVLALLVVLMPP
jgi:hypothetical protein